MPWKLKYLRWCTRWIGLAEARGALSVFSCAGRQTGLAQVGLNLVPEI